MGNLDKLLHGRSAIESVEVLLKMVMEKGYVTEIISPFRNGYPDYDQNQFYVQFLIRFSDGEKWLIHSTTSFRERVNGVQWNVEHLKALDKDITKAILVYPDEKEKEVISFQNYSARIHKYNHSKIQKGILYSEIDEVISFQDLYYLLEGKGLEGKDKGSVKAKQGYNFEEWLVTILNEPSNLSKWNIQQYTIAGFHYVYFTYMLENFGINTDEMITSIHATNKIPLLPPRPNQKRGGKPKTDILLNIVFATGLHKRITISLKRTSSDWVACHQFSVQNLVDELGIQDRKLIDALDELQLVGGAYTLLDDKTLNVLEEKLPAYNEELARWALAGIGGPGIPDIHWIQYLGIYKNETDEFEIYELNDYIKKILPSEGYYKTPFKWTYPSKQKTRQLQLRVKVI
jgi:hypothetical protein